MTAEYPLPTSSVAKHLEKMIDSCRHSSQTQPAGYLRLKRRDENLILGYLRIDPPTSNSYPDVVSSIRDNTSVLPLGESQEDDAHEKLIKEGMLIPAKRKRNWLKPPLKLGGKPLSELLDEVRG